MHRLIRILYSFQTAVILLDRNIIFCILKNCLVKFSIFVFTITSLTTKANVPASFSCHLFTSKINTYLYESLHVAGK
jgi:hypothetical protein